MDNQSHAPPAARPPSSLWRIGLAIGLLLTTGLLLALWPFLQAVNSALTHAIDAYGGFVAGALLLFGLGVLATGLWMLAAIALRLTASARQSHILRAPGDLPIHVADVRYRAKRPTVFDQVPMHLERHAASLLAEAERATPLLTSQNQHIHIEGTAPPQIEAHAPPQLPAFSGSGGTLAQLRQIGHICRSGNSLLVGYSAGQPQYIELPECGFIGIGGQPRVGKSVTASLIIDQAVLSGWHVFVGDPHIQKADGLLNRLRPLSGRLQRQCVTPDEIAAMIRMVDKIGRRRVDGDQDRTPVLLILDEFSNLVWRDLLPPDVLAILPSMAAEYAGVGVHGVLIAHDWSKASLGGDLGAALRRTITHRLIHRMDPGNVEFLLPKSNAAQARAVQGLDKGQALYFGPDGATSVAVPFVGDDDAAYAAQGTPPSPYAPRQTGAAGPPPAPPLAPTTRVPPPRAAPPTVPMGPPTVPEQIADLLRGRTAWMTASEIAAQLGADLATVRTELSTMSGSGQLRKRQTTGRTTKEKYEYAAQLAQPFQPGMTITA